MRGYVSVISLVIYVSFLTASCSSISDVKISTIDTEVIKGKTLQLKAVVLGNDNPDTTVKWEIKETTNVNTKIGDNGLLKVALDEKSSYLTIKATSIQDKNKFAETKIKVTLNPELIFGKWVNKSGKIHITMKLSKNQVDFIVLGGLGLINFKEVKWTPAVNEDDNTKEEFPKGFIFSGIARKVVKITDVSTGEYYSNKIFINSENTKILRVTKTKSFIYKRSD